MVKTLERKQVIGLSEEIYTTGHSPLKVIADDTATYFIKNYEGKLPAYYLASEIICHYLLSIWEIPTPDIALLEIKAKALKAQLAKFSKRHKPMYYDIPAVGSLLVLGEIVELNALTEPRENINIDRIENEQDLWKIALFDIWVENDDRKPSNPNMLRQQTNFSAIKLYALDHAFCFNSLKYKDLEPSFGITQGFNDNILYTDLAKHILSKYAHNPVFEAEVHQYFQQKIQLCEADFDTIWNFMPLEFGLEDDDRNKLYQFLFHEERNQEVVKYFFEHIHEY